MLCQVNFSNQNEVRVMRAA